MQSIDHPDVRALIETSRHVILDHQSASGAYPACPTFSVYGYSWFRDGAFIADGVSRHGERASADAFHAWCAGVLADRGDHITDVVGRLNAGDEVPATEMLPTRFTLDGRDGTDEWWDFQLDGYGTWLWVLAEHSRGHGGPSAAIRDSARLAARYLAASWQLPCFDWWEEHQQHVHVSTLGAIEAGLRSALELGVVTGADQERVRAALDGVRRTIADAGTVDGRLRKWLGSDAVDGSLLSLIAPLDVVDTAVAAETVRVIEQDLVAERGVHRYRDDTFYGGGRWPVLAGFLGLAYHRLGRVDDAHAQLAWMASTADGDGLLPEQIGDPLLFPERHQEWVERWGVVAQPLLWSHGMYLTLSSSIGVTA